MANYSAQEVANWFLAWTDDDPEILITNLKLQKLLYYAQAHYLANTGEPLFSNDLEAWRLGPVVREVYDFYASIAKEEKAKTGKHLPLSLQSDFDFAKFTDYDNQFLIQLWESYGHYEPNDLVDLTHSEAPWIENYYVDESFDNRVISKNAIKNYFQKAAA
jgi:uncharacterized phage-associated protein